LYEIVFRNKTVGKAEVKKEGLYYKITCVCKPPNQKLHRIIVSDGITERDLGICVPDESGFSLTTRVPIKHIQGDNLSFSMKPHGENSADSQKQVEMPIQTGGVFMPLDKLEKARLRIKNGQPEIVITG